MNNAIEISQLTREFGAVRALQSLTYSVRAGEVFGVLGPNGAGKTTTVRVLNGVLAPTSGQVRVLGLDPATQGAELRRRTGVLTETPCLYERLSARENLTIFGNLYGVPEAQLPGRVSALLETFGLSARAGDKTGGFSKGMKQRLALARALLHEPELIFMDEPTAGLDPEAARHVTRLIEQLSHQQGRTIFLCTHNLNEAQRLCDRVAMMNHGNLLAVGTLAELSRTLWRGMWVDIVFRVALTPEQINSLRHLPGISDVQLDGVELAAKVESESVAAALVATLAAGGAQILRVNPRDHSLEEIYFQIQDQQGQN